MTINEFAELVEREQTEAYVSRNPETPKDILLRHCETRVVLGKKYTKVNVGDSGKFMIDADGNIFGIKGYGVIHKGHRYGTLETTQEWFWGEYYPVFRSAGACQR